MPLTTLGYIPHKYGTWLGKQCLFTYDESCSLILFLSIAVATHVTVHDVRTTQQQNYGKYNAVISRSLFERIMMFHQEAMRMSCAYSPFASWSMAYCCCKLLGGPLLQEVDALQKT